MIRHTIVTRCNFDNDKKFNQYFDVMKKTYIPSINSQTNKNFFISLCVNPKHFDLIRKEIDEGIMFSMLKFSDCHALCSKYSRTNTFIVTYFTTS